MALQQRLRQRVQRLLDPVDVRIDGDRPWDLRVQDRHFFGRVLRQGSLGLGEAYMDGWWDAASLEESLRKLAEELGVGSGKVFQPLRVALVGQLASPGIFDMLMVLGRERSLARLDSAIGYLSTPSA